MRNGFANGDLRFVVWVCELKINNLYYEKLKF